MYSFRGYNHSGRSIKPSIDCPAKIEVPEIRNPSIGTMGLRENKRARKAIIKEIIKSKAVIKTRSVTKNDHTKIQQMRLRGFSYSKIAAALGLTRNQISGICNRWGF